MSGEEFVIALTAIIAGTILVGFVLGNIFKIINQWINRKKGGEFGDEDFERLAKAFMHHKKEMIKRIQSLEEIVTNTDDTHSPEISYPELEEPKSESSLNNALESRKQKSSQNE